MRGRVRRRRQEVTSRPSRPPSVRPTTERSKSLPATARPPPSRAARRSVSRASARLAWTTVRWSKPAYPRYNRGAGGGLCPLDPQTVRAEARKDRGRRFRRDG